MRRGWTGSGASHRREELIYESSPQFEITDRSSGAVRYLEHGYPSPLVRWHWHNEYELHYIVASSGKVFVGDYIGEFRPGNLILTGPRLPHNWISNAEAEQNWKLRDMVVHFDHEVIASAADQIPELAEVMPLLRSAKCGIQFHDVLREAEHYMPAIRDASGLARFGYFCQFMHVLSHSSRQERLSTMQFENKADEAGLDKVNTVVNFVTDNYRRNIVLEQAAAMVGMSQSYFSRFFKHATGNTFSEFLTRIRISKACELLSSTDRQITAICYEVGYNNVSNFNRRFLERKQVTPRLYRQQARQRLSGRGVTSVSTGAALETAHQHHHSKPVVSSPTG